MKLTMPACGLLLVPLGLCACSLTAKPKPAALPPAIHFVSPKGSALTIQPTAIHDKFSPKVVGKVKELPADAFAARYRRTAKTTPATGQPAFYKNLYSLLNDLAPDSEMLSQWEPGEYRKKDFPRSSYEDGNVRLQAWIYAMALQADHSYRLIIGSHPTREGSRFISAIVSGVPADGPWRGLLAQARHKFEAYFGPQLPANADYRLIDPPVPVRLAGSVYFDAEHGPDEIGPGRLKPTTAWELRPVTDIELEPQASSK